MQQHLASAWMMACLLISVSAFQYRPLGTRSTVRQSSTALNAVVDDKVEVKQYFDNEGFSRWNKIYSDSDDVNKVQLDIRTGHQQTIDKVLNWFSVEDNGKNTVCDAGCGVGSLAIPLSSKFKKVFASDISSSMTKEAELRAKADKIRNIEFKVSDMETLGGSYDTVTCIDVMIHYPTDQVPTTYLPAYLVQQPYQNQVIVVPIAILRCMALWVSWASCRRSV